MHTDPSAQPDPAAEGLDEGIPPGAIERFNLVTVLRDITARLTAMEASLFKAGKDPSASKGRLMIDLCKVIFGGWPAFGFLFLILFFSPLRDALRSMAEKVRSADEIQVGCVSLKTTIREVAVRSGATELSETVPALSSAATDLLLGGRRVEPKSIAWSIDGKAAKASARSTRGTLNQRETRTGSIGYSMTQ